MSKRDHSGHITIDVFRSVLKSQYHAALAMLRETIEQCSDDVWFSQEHANAFWQIAYHTLFFNLSSEFLSMRESISCT
jgi:hypothetical protein